jgi:hypothetical protein
MRWKARENDPFSQIVPKPGLVAKTIGHIGNASQKGLFSGQKTGQNLCLKEVLLLIDVPEGFVA